MIHARRLALALAPAALLVLFFYLPLLSVVALTFGADARGSPAEAWNEIWNSKYFRNRILFTFHQASLSTLVSLAAGLPLAYVFASYRFPGKRLLRSALTVPFVLPALVVAIALQSAYGPNGLLSRALGLDVLGILGPMGSIVLAHSFYNVGLVLRIVGGFWERIPWSLREACRTLGGSHREVLLRVLLPLGLPAILASGLLIFLFSLTSFAIILLLGDSQSGTIETLIYEETRSFRADYTTAALLGLLQLAITLFVVLLYVHLQRAAARQFPPRVVPPPQRLNAAGALVCLILTVFVLLPLFSLIASSLNLFDEPTSKGYRLLWSQEFPLGSYDVADAILNSIQFGLIAVLIAVPLAVLAAQAARGLRTRRLVWESALLGPLGLSSVLLGLGFLIAFDGDPLWDLRANRARIMIAHALIAFPLVSRIISPSLDALDPNLLQAARTLGANAWQTIRRVELPLLAPPLATASVFAFAVSLGEFGATLVLRRPEFTTLPLAIFDAYGRPGAAFRAQAEALSVLLLLVALLSFWLLETLPQQEHGGIA